MVKKSNTTPASDFTESTSLVPRAGGNICSNISFNSDAKRALFYGTVLAVLVGAAVFIIKEEAPDKIPDAILEWNLNGFELALVTTLLAEAPLVTSAFLISSAIHHSPAAAKALGKALKDFIEIIKEKYTEINISKAAKLSFFGGSALAGSAAIITGVVNSEAPKLIPSFISNLGLNSIALGFVILAVTELPFVAAAYIIGTLPARFCPRTADMSFNYGIDNPRTPLVPA